MQLINKNILVTGGAGFIGSHLVDALIKENPAKLVIIDNLFLGKEKNILDAQKNFPDLKFYKESLTDFDKIKQIITDNKIDIVFNLAIIPLPISLEKPKWTFSENVKMTENLCELAKQKLFDLLVHFSSSEAYGTAQTVPMTEKHPLNTHTSYAASKAATDHLVYSYYKTFGIKAIIIRPFNNYGPRQNEGSYAGIIPLTIKKILSNQSPELYGDGCQTRDFIYVKDAAEMTLQLSKCEQAIGKTINLGSGIEITMKKLIEKICKILDYTGEIKNAPERPGDVRRLLASTELAKKLIDFNLKTDFDRGLKETIKWYEEEIK